MTATVISLETKRAGRVRSEDIRTFCRGLEERRRAQSHERDESIAEMLGFLNEEAPEARHEVTILDYLDHCEPKALFDVTITDGKTTRFNSGQSVTFARTACEIVAKYPTLGMTVTVVPHRERAHLRVVK